MDNMDEPFILTTEKLQLYIEMIIELIRGAFLEESKYMWCNQEILIQDQNGEILTNGIPIYTFFKKNIHNEEQYTQLKKLTLIIMEETNKERKILGNEIRVASSKEKQFHTLYSFVIKIEEKLIEFCLREPSFPGSHYTTDDDFDDENEVYIERHNDGSEKYYILKKCLNIGNTKILFETIRSPTGYDVIIVDQIDDKKLNSTNELRDIITDEIKIDYETLLYQVKQISEYDIDNFLSCEKVYIDLLKKRIYGNIIRLLQKLSDFWSKKNEISPIIIEWPFGKFKIIPNAQTSQTIDIKKIEAVSIDQDTLEEICNRMHIVAFFENEINNKDKVEKFHSFTTSNINILEVDS